MGSELWQCCSEELRTRLKLRMMAAWVAGTAAVALSPAQSKPPQSLPAVGAGGQRRGVLTRHDISLLV